MKRILLSFLALLSFVISAQADSFEVDGICYNITWDNGDPSTPGEVYVAQKTGGYSGDIEIPATVTYTKTYNVKGIEWQAFKDCTKLTSVTIKDGMTDIAGEVFYGCSKLTSVTIPNSVTSLGSNVFSGCSKLTDVTLSNKLTSIEWGAFQNCTSLTSITIPDGVTIIHGSAFWGCEKLSSITIPKVEKIENSAFWGCSKLASIDISGVTQTAIEANTFQNCTSLTSITIPDDVDIIGDWAFAGCTSLTSINIPTSLTKIGEYAFNGCEKLSSSIVLPNSVTTILRSAFSGCKALTSVDISACQLSTIEESVFSDCESLTSITIPNGVEIIKSGAFHACKSFTSITIPNGVETIGTQAFQDNFSLVSITIPNSVTEIGQEAFWNCNKLESVTIPGSVVKIGDNAFIYCGSLKVVTSEIETPFKVNAFDGIFETASLVVPKDKRADYKSTEGWNFGLIFEKGEPIGDRELTDEQGIKYALKQAADNSLYYTVTGHTAELKSEIVFPAVLGSTAEFNGFPVTTIEGQTFVDSKNLTKITIPNSVKEIGWWAFQNCKNLTTVILSNQLTTIEDGLFNGCTNLASIIIPNSVTSIGRDAFCACNKLASVQLGNQLTTIEESAFNGCAFTSITIPSSVTTIGDYAFDNCNSITKVTSEILEPKEVNTFNWWGQNATLVVPEGLVATYKSLGGWNQFGLIIENGEIVNDSEKTEDGIKYALRQAEDNSVYYAVIEITDVQKTEIVIPAELDGCPVKAIEGWNLFQNCKSLTKLTIPSSITKIENNPLYGCIKLDDVYIVVLDDAEFCNNNILKTIEENIWDENNNQKSFNLHLIDNEGNEITEYDIPEGVTTIGDGAFKGCTGLTSITIPDGVTSIGNRAFYLCKAWTDITIPSSVTTIGNNAFYGCYSIDELNVVVSDYSKFCNNQILKAFEYPINYWDPDAKQSFINYYPIHLIDDAGYEISEYIIPDGVTTIGEATFRGCTGLTSIAISNSVTSIGKDAFNGCINLASVKMGKKVTSIGDNAFYNCLSLESITLPKKLESIGNYAFSSGDEYNNWNWEKYIPIVSIAIPGTVETIGNDAFRGCRELALVTFEVDEDGITNLTSIGDEAFRYCALTSLTLPNTVTTIGKQAFAENGQLTTAILGDAITEIKDETFYNCYELTSVSIPDGVTSIGSSAFRDCHKLTSIRIPSSLSSMGEQAFENCPLKSIELPDAFTVIPANLFKTNDFEYIKLGNNVKSIGKNAFGCKLEGEESFVAVEIATSTPPSIVKDAFPNLDLSVINVIVPDDAAEKAYKKASVWKDMTYANKDNVVEITVSKPGELSVDLITELGMPPAKVVGLKVKGAINGDDFTQMRSNMKSLLRLDLSECDITEIPDGAMYGKTQLQELTLPTKLKTIGNKAFTDCPYLTGKLELPSGVTSIGDRAFEGTNYTSVTLPNRLQTIGNFAFYNLPIKQKIILPDALTMIGDYAFADTYISGHAEFPEGITYLGAGAFRNTQIDPVSLPDNPNGITSISWGLFQGCPSFDYIYIPRNITEVSGFAFDGCSALTYVRMSPELKTLGEYAFQNTQLEYLKVPSKVEILPDGVLKNCKSLESLSLPANLKKVGSEALRGCGALRNLSVEAIEPPTVDRSSLVGVNTDLCLISIPTESYKKYVLAEYWGQFVQMRNDIAVETEGNGEIAFESVEEGEEDDALSRTRTRGQRYAAARARTRGSEEEDELQMTFANNGSSIYVPKNGQVRFFIMPAEGETLVSATLDGVDITKDIKDGVYTATADKKNAKLVVKFSGAGQNTETIKVSAANQLAYCSDQDLDFTTIDALKAYVATGYDNNTGTIWLTRVKEVPANTGFLIMGEAGEYPVPVKSGGSNAYYKNMFKGTLEAMTLPMTEKIDGKEYANYYLSKGDYGVGFYKVTKTGGQSLQANRAYLPIPTEIPAVGTAGGTETIKVSAAGQVPYYSANSLDFTTLDNVKAYTATGYDYEKGTIWLTRVKKVPAETGILIMADKGEYPVPTASVASIYENMFKGSLTASTIYTTENIAGVDYINYYLSNGDSGVGFYKVTKADGQSLGANRCYLPIPQKSAAGTRSVDDDPTNISVQESDEVIGIRIFASGTTGISATLNDEGEMMNDNVWYNIQGQRVENPGKGIYIRNGKKVVIK